MINHKRTERIYREEGLALRRKRRRKGAAVSRVVMPSAQRSNEHWSMDFVTDSIVTGRRFRALVYCFVNSLTLVPIVVRVNTIVDVIPAQAGIQVESVDSGSSPE